MRKIILSMVVSIDGYIESRDPEEYWHNWNDEMSAYMMDFFKTVDTFIYGRKSYEDMKAYWPPLTGGFADVMNQTPKLVCSRTLKTVGWNSKLISDNIEHEIQLLKQQSGKDMVLFAGADLADAFIRLNLIDEYRLIVNPVVLGGGKPLFKNITSTMSLKHRDTITFNCGNVILIYGPLIQNTL